MTHSPELLLLATIAVVLIAAAVMILFRLQLTPEQKEHRRRVRLNVLGRLSDGSLTEVDNGVVYYTYQIAGVVYASSQDISKLRKFVPDDSSLILGPIAIKYLPRNPADSIVLCEHWSGLRLRERFLNSQVVTAQRKETIA